MKRYHLIMLVLVCGTCMLLLETSPQLRRRFRQLSGGERADDGRAVPPHAKSLQSIHMQAVDFPGEWRVRRAALHLPKPTC